MQRAVVQVVVGGEEKNQPKPLSSENKSDHSVAGLKHQTPNICCAYPSLRVCHVITPRKRHRIISNSQTRQGEVRVRGGGGRRHHTHTFDTAWPFTWNRRSAGLAVHLEQEVCWAGDPAVLFEDRESKHCPTAQTRLHQSISHISYSAILNTN